MISDAQLQQIELALWPQGDATPGSLWAILDCARDKRIYRELQVSRLDYQCLYGGDIATELRVVAPHMVELSPRYQFTKTLIAGGWENSWGLFVRINDGTRLRHHLRKLLTVQSEDGRRLLFRYFDPRVMRVYLPTCTPDEHAEVFGPISRWYVEGTAAESCLHTYALDDRRLVMQSTPVDRT